MSGGPRRRTTRGWLAIGATVAVCGLAAVPSAHAGAPAPTPTLTVAPTVVADGQPFTMTGTGCIDPDTGTGDGLRAYFAVEGFGYPNVDDPTGLLGGSSDVAADGTWTRTAAPVKREAQLGPFDDFDSQVQAWCTRGSIDSQLFAYDPVPIRYDGTADDDAAPTPPSTPVGPEPPSDSTPTPPSAEPVPASPTFTG